MSRALRVLCCAAVLAVVGCEGTPFDPGPSEADIRAACYRSSASEIADMLTLVQALKESGVSSAEALEGSFEACGRGNEECAHCLTVVIERVYGL